MNRHDQKQQNAAANEFEFLRALPFGPYLPVDSPLQRLDPRTRIILVVLFLAVITVVAQPLGLVISLVIILLGWWVGGVPFEPLRRSWLTVLPFLLILALIQVLFYVRPGNQVLLTIGSLSISDASIWAGVKLLLRFSAYMALLGLAAASLSESELTHGLEALLHPLTVLRIPVQDFVLAVQVTMRFFPLLAQSAERIAKAQASRGADWRPSGWNLIQRARQFFPLLVPLFVTSLRRAENMAMAMDARGYGALPYRTSMVSLHWKRSDALVIAAAVLVVVSLFLV